MSDMERETRALTLDDEGERMGSLSKERLETHTPDKRVVRIWGHCLSDDYRVCQVKCVQVSRTDESVLASKLPSHHHLPGQWEPAGFWRSNGVSMPHAFGPPQTLKSDYLSLKADSATHFLALSIYALFPPLR